ncbi:MAG: hypothetical protein GY864_10510 [Desulfobacterales bacterium]|nr:hypothetical protein [Desulfobacterales bacterium]
METYQFESIIEDNGTIVLPGEIKKKLNKHRVRLMLVDLETLRRNPVELLEEITQEYTHIVDEPDLDITEIYMRRGERNDRESLFT